MDTTAPQGKALLSAPKNPAPAATQNIVEVAREYGVSPLRQLREMALLRFGPGKLDSHEYVSTGVFRPELSMAEKRSFVGRTGSYDVNVACSPLKLTESRAFLRDKVMYTALLRQLGFETTTTQAVVSANRHFGDIPALRSPAEVQAFLLGRAKYPLFVKPCEGAGSVGSALITNISRDTGLLHLGNGRTADIEGFAHEIIADYPEGFILQSAIRQHPDMHEVTGDAVGTLRMVTLRDADGISPLYTVWKVPSPRAMSDNFWQAGSMVAEVDDRGQVLRCNQGSGLNARWIDEHPTSGRSFAGFVIPHFARLREQACTVHGLFPEFGIIGWDIAMGETGPVIVEANDNPFHTLWQLATGQGIRNAAFSARLDAAAQESNRILSARIATFQSRQKARTA